MQIEQRFISQNRSYEYFEPMGCVVHCTATPGADSEDEFSYFNNNEVLSSAHAFVDWNKVIQTIPFNEIAWHCMYTGNHRFIGIEICEPGGHDPELFNRAYNNAVEYFAYVFVNILGIRTITTENLMSHADVTRRWHETDHLDPEDFFASYGKTVDGFRRDVQNKINSNGGEVSMSSNQGIVTADCLNVRSGPSSNSSIIGTLSYNDVVTINRLNGDWYDIYFGDNGGYVSKDYIKTDFGKSKSKPAPKKIVKHRNCIVYGNDVDKRAALYLYDYFKDLGEDPVIVSKDEYVQGMGVSVFTVGGGLDSIKSNVAIKDTNRYTTALKVLMRILNIDSVKYK